MNKKMQDQLVARAAEASGKAYAPYSKFRVGAALLTAGGGVVTGVNVENASYGLALCAERAALAAAVAAGFRRFKAMAVAASGRQPVVPCGACLQALAEFCGPDFPIIAAKANSPGTARVYKLGDLLPHVFRFRK
jgi:cytidine deaminase